jgi:hypothetical protein
MTLTQKAEYIANQCADAYSADRYRSWKSVAMALLKLGWKPIEVEAFMRSKHTRWAGDSSNNAYGTCSANDVLRHIEDGRCMPRGLQTELNELVAGTWDAGEQPTYPFE